MEDGKERKRRYWEKVKKRTEDWEMKGDGEGRRGEEKERKKRRV